MSFDEEGKLIAEPITQNDSDSKLFKLDMPIGKLKFFVNSIILFAIHLVIIGLYCLIYFMTKTPESYIALLGIFLLIFGIPMLYLNFVNYTKRMWDITGSFHRGLWFTVGLFAISSICIFLFPIAILFFYFAMIFMPGELVNSSKDI